MNDSTYHSPIDWLQFREMISSARRILLTSHVRPDCDALGSELAMCEILEKLGKDVRVVNAEPVPERFHFLDQQDRFEVLADVPNEWLDSIDLLLVLDTSAWAQLGGMSELVRATAKRATVAVLDHHVSGDELGATLFKDPKAEATGRLVCQAADQLNIDLTPEMALSIYAAVATDTGWFRFSSVTHHTYALAAQLAAAGVQPDQLYCDLYEQESLGRLKLVGLAMAKVTAEMDGRLIHTNLTIDDFDSAGALASDSEDVVNMMLTVAGTQVAIILVEQRTGGFKISFRSRCEVDCSRLAEQFSGGGHKKAAGAFIDQPLEDTERVLLDAATQAILAMDAARSND